MVNIFNHYFTRSNSKDEDDPIRYLSVSLEKQISAGLTLPVEANSKRFFWHFRRESRDCSESLRSLSWDEFDTSIKRSISVEIGGHICRWSGPKSAPSYACRHRPFTRPMVFDSLHIK